MRTTLKKGTKQSANGNGAFPPSPAPVVEPQAGAAPPGGNGPPPLPVADSGRSFYRVRRNPLKLLAKGVIWLVVVVLVATGALAGGVKLYFDYSVSEIQASSPEVKDAAQELAELSGADKPAVAIVIGYDMQRDQTAAGSRSDTVMLVRVDPQKDVVSLLSFPRDLRVSHPGCEGHPPWTGRINEAYAYCGARGTVSTVKELTGIPINYLITVNFEAFKRIVDRLDGVYMDVDQRYLNTQEGVGYPQLDLKPGYQLLDGPDALDFVRFRHTDSDLYRVVRQQEFVKALKQRVSSAWDVFELPGIVKAVTENIEVAKGGGKPISSGEVLGYAQALYGLPAGNFQQVPLEGVSGYFELEISDESLQEAVRRFASPDVEASEDAITVATGRQAREDTGPQPAEVRIQVLNGNGEDGSADEAAVLLRRIGYKTRNGGNADNFDYFRTRVLYDPEAEEGEVAAQQVAELFGNADVQAAPAGEPFPTVLQVTVGQTFQGTLGPGPAEDIPKRSRPEVVNDRGAILPALRQLRREVDFPLMVPTVIEAGSSIEDDEGIRAYKLADDRAARLTYNTGSNEFWGIQQTGWDEPPILAEPTLERTLGGRQYKLFFSGPRLHIVAFEEEGAVYWVVNTLRNALSNETMLAIAKGLKPLPGGQ
jgi:polyisoprenyl-teichoic acid--peptidoglycan teichoic acid transferase